MTTTPDDGPGADPGAAVKPTEEWVTGDEPATAAQVSYLQTLARDVGEDVPEGMTKAQASELIDRLRQRSPRVEAGADAPVQEPPD